MRMKKTLAIVLATTTVLASSMTAMASGSGSGSGSGATSSTTTSPAVQAAVAVETAATAATVSEVKAADGTKLVTTVAGAYSATTIAGSAVTTPIADLSAAMGLTGNQKPYMIVMDTDQKKSFAAMASINGAVKALGATMGPVINVNLGIRDGVNFTTVEKNDKVKVSYTIGIPKSFQDATSTYMVVGVYYGGEIVVYEDKDAKADTITVEIPVGLGAYAIIKK